MRTPRRTVAAAALALAVGAACGDDAPPTTASTTATAATTDAPADADTSTTTVPGPPFDVETAEITVVDPSRPTVAGGEELAPERTLVTDLYLPIGAGPFPLIVHAHGLDGHPRKFSRLLTAWAAAGFVVAAPAFPLTNDELDRPTVVGDYVEQPADLRAVIDEVLALGEQGVEPVGDRVDPSRVGVSGLSLGSGTAYAVAFHGCCRDDRVDAAMVMAALRFPFEGGEYDLSGRPLMLLHGTADPTLPFADTQEAYEAAAPPRYLVALEGAGHAGPFEDAETDHDEVVTASTTAYWRLTLGGEPRAHDELIAAADAPGLATPSFDLGDT